jgi:TonB family protein
MQDHSLFYGVSLEQSSLVKRLFEQFIEAGREFHSNPRQFIISLVKGEGLGSRRRKQFLQYGLAISLLVYSTFFLATLIFWTVAHRGDTGNKEKDSISVRLIFPPSSPPNQAPEVRKGEKDIDDGGGGGGGNHSNMPATLGQAPEFALDPTPMAPTTRPTLSPPSLPMVEQLRGDPAQNLKRDDLAPTGIPNGAMAPPSDGPGSGKGIGTGEDGGVGSGKKRGLGPGEDGGQHKGTFTLGQHRPNPETNETVDSKPIALNKPRPNYTEEARKAKVQGSVRARVLVGADGTVKQVKISGGGLPDGLNEEAIQAAKQMRFQPAMKNGEKVAYWVTIEIEFNLR